jgi:hypothetical protein
MFFQIGTGNTVRSLEMDDKAWASYRYPTEVYSGTFGSISGNITYGYDNQPVAGALVEAIRLNTDPVAPNDTIHAYSDADGNYLYRVASGIYNIFIEPLDGDVRGRKLWPENISYYIGNNTVYLDYPGEFYNDNDVAVEENDLVTTVTVSAGSVTESKNIITNQDKTPPKIELVKRLWPRASGQRLTNFNIRFSELVDMETLMIDLLVHKSERNH